MAACNALVTLSKATLQISVEPYLDFLSVDVQLSAPLDLELELLFECAPQLTALMLSTRHGHARDMLGYEPGMQAGRWTLRAVECQGDPLPITAACAFDVIYDHRL
jgi:hypothetical protein